MNLTYRILVKYFPSYEQTFKELQQLKEASSFKLHIQLIQQYVCGVLGNFDRKVKFLLLINTAEGRLYLGVSVFKGVSPIKYVKGKGTLELVSLLKVVTTESLINFDFIVSYRGIKMNIADLQGFEARLESMKNPRERRSFLHSLYCDLNGKNYSDDIKTTTANSPYLVKTMDVSLQKEREFIQYGANILRRFGFETHADKLLDAYKNSHLQVDPSEGYAAENRTRALDRLIGVSERVLLFPTNMK